MRTFDPIANTAADRPLPPSHKRKRVNGGNAMDQRIFVARLNIEHYQQRLASETDESKRQMIRRLLSEEEVKLAALEQPAKEPNR